MTLPPPMMSAYEVASWIRRTFDGEFREDFLSDPGGWLAYYGVSTTDDAALAAITTIEREWK
jgi:hypothetical protein